MRNLPALSRKQLKDHIFSRGESWFACHPEESDTIRNNCNAFGVQCDSELENQIRHNILLHYYEKLLPFSMTPPEFHDYITQRVALPEKIGIFKKSLSEKKSVLLAVCHFGAVELIGPSLAAQGIPFIGTVRFATGLLAETMRLKATQLKESGLFAEIQFIEIGNGTAAASLEMAAVLRRGGLLCAVFDEPTRYGVDVTLFNRRIHGGAGIDRLAAFMNNDVVVVTAFMPRTGDETYNLNISEQAGAGKGLIQSMYGAFETVCLSRLPQWYFLHEDISFVK
jgi:lauroyl/myristoyl acyltransferase